MVCVGERGCIIVLLSRLPGPASRLDQEGISEYIYPYRVRMARLGIDTYGVTDLTGLYLTVGHTRKEAGSERFHRDSSRTEKRL
jgi:hypothetical protein